MSWKRRSPRSTPFFPTSPSWAAAARRSGWRAALRCAPTPGDGLSRRSRLARRHPIELVNSVNPYRLEGQKTAAFEICEDLEAAPDYLAIPVGNAGNISAYWKGFKEYRDAGHVSATPKMIGFQALGASPLVPRMNSP